MQLKRDVNTQNLLWLRSTDLRLNMETNKLESVVSVERAHYCCHSAANSYKGTSYNTLY